MWQLSFDSSVWIFHFHVGHTLAVAVHSVRSSLFCMSLKLRQNENKFFSVMSSSMSWIESSHWVWCPIDVSKARRLQLIIQFVGQANHFRTCASVTVMELHSLIYSCNARFVSSCNIASNLWMAMNFACDQKANSNRKINLYLILWRCPINKFAFTLKFITEYERRNEW